MLPTEVPITEVEQLRLNLGCGDRYAPGWLNVDWEFCPHRKDLTLDLRTSRLPWPPGTVRQVYCGHLFEHLTPERCYTLAANLRQLAADTCEIVVVGPDMHLIRQMIDHGQPLGAGHSFHSLRDGGGRWAGDQHEWETTGPAVFKILHQAGWPVVTDDSVRDLSYRGWPVADPEPRWQYAVRGYNGPLSGFPGKKSPSGSP